MSASSVALFSGPLRLSPAIFAAVSTSTGAIRVVEPVEEGKVGVVVDWAVEEEKVGGDDDKLPALTCAGVYTLASGRIHQIKASYTSLRPHTLA